MVRPIGESADGQFVSQRLSSGTVYGIGLNSDCLHGVIHAHSVKAIP